ncbi:thiol-disulfide isomerase [Pseudomonas sp. UL073]|uniref:Thiol-disulfide isomerase n=1 Tax=Zestomonas insulae TaxID=2809017 RepID=A0ABS2IKD7_9GAMM|nr:DUF6436 domain-containing protein [Pseudomonas insulae]MBM7062452.1 thiol-disulfide isomerase [Pseudomonas insulae]
MSPSRRKTLLAGLLLLLGLAAALAAVRWYEGRYLRPFAAQTQLFDGTQLQLPAALRGAGPIRVVHFWDPACPCNVGNQQHLAELLARFAPQGVKFYALQKPGSHGQLPPTLSAIEALPALPGSAQLPASPAVGIWDAQGRLAYFGPYSEGASCTSSNSFIEPILEALAAGRTVNASNTLAVGCFCAWAQPD